MWEKVTGVKGNLLPFFLVVVVKLKHSEVCRKQLHSKKSTGVPFRKGAQGIVVTGLRNRMAGTR